MPMLPNTKKKEQVANGAKLSVKLEPIILGPTVKVIQGLNVSKVTLSFSDLNRFLKENNNAQIRKQVF